MPQGAPRRGWMLGEFGAAGDLVAFDEWPLEGDTHVVWRLESRSRVRVLSYAEEVSVGDVSHGRIAVIRSDGVEVVTAAGERVALLRRGIAYGSRVVLDDDLLVVQDERTLLAYSISREVVVATHRLPSSGAELLDAKAGLAVYGADGGVRILDLRTGVAAIIAIPEAAPPFAAAFNERGLFLAHHRIHVRVPGRVGFIPMGRLRAAVLE